MQNPGLIVNPQPETPPEPIGQADEGMYVEPLAEETGATPAEAPVESGPPQFQPDQQLTQLQQELQRYKQAEVLQTLQNQMGQYAQQLVQAGWSPEQAQAEVMRQAHTRVLEMAVEHHQSQNDHIRKTQVAAYLANKYGATPADLMMAPTPEAMESLAQKLGNRERETKDFNERLGQVEKRQVSPQQYDSNRGSQRGVRVTTDNIDALYNQGRVTDAVYRRFLETGRI